MIKQISILAFLLLAFISAFSQKAIPAKEAANHKNETVMITDTIAGGKYLAASIITLLDIGAPHPKEVLTLLIEGDDRKKFTIAPEVLYKGKKVTITGTVIDYKGKPEIIIAEPERIKIVE